MKIHLKTSVVLRVALGLACVLVFGIHSNFLFSHAAMNPVIAVGNVSGTPGSTIALPVTFTGSSLPVSAFQFDLSIGNDLSYLATLAGSAASVATKQVVANEYLPKTVRVLVYSLEQNPVSSGVIARIDLRLPDTSSIKNFPIAISGIVASSPDAIEVPTDGINGTLVGCKDPSPVSTGYAAPCPVFAVSPASLSSSQPLAISVVPDISKTVYIYKTLYITEGNTWKIFTLPGTVQYTYWLTGYVPHNLSPAQSGLSSGIHYLASWEWTWDQTANNGAGCYKGPDNLCYPDSSKYRLQQVTVL